MIAVIGIDVNPFSHLGKNVKQPCTVRIKERLFHHADVAKIRVIFMDKLFKQRIILRIFFTDNFTCHVQIPHIVIVGKSVMI